MKLLFAIGWGFALATTLLTGILAFDHTLMLGLPFGLISQKWLDFLLEPSTRVLNVSIFAYQAVVSLLLLGTLWLSLASNRSDDRRSRNLRSGIALLTLVTFCVPVVYGYAFLQLGSVYTSLAAVFASCAAMVLALGERTTGKTLRIKIGLLYSVAVVCGVGLVLASKSRGPNPAAPLNFDALKRVPLADLMPSDSPSLGPRNAKETIVVFIDGECPFCAEEFPRLYKAASLGTIRLVVRHFPLAIHYGAFDDAVGSELAAERGQFWEFESALYNHKGTPEDILIGERWSESDISARLRLKDPSRIRVTRDQSFGEELGIQSVPCAILISNGVVAPVSTKYVNRRFKL